MKAVSHRPGDARVRSRAAVLAALVTLVATGLLLPLAAAHAAHHAADPVLLGTAESFAILAGSTITNTGQSTVAGDIGLDPGTAVTGFGPGADAITHLDGEEHIDDAVAEQAKVDLTTAYNNARDQTLALEIPTELSTSTVLTPGIYDSASGTFELTGTLTLDAGGDPDAVFIFQMVTTLVTASASSLVLTNEASPCNVFWQVGSSATLGAASSFGGTIMADQDITLGTGATLDGRALASVAAVTLQGNIIDNSSCATTTGDDSTTGGEDDADTATGAEDDTDTATKDGAPEDDTDTTPEDDSSRQVEEVPGGPVAAGGGGVDTGPGGRSLLLAASLMLVAVGGTVGFARRRIRAQDA